MGRLAQHAAMASVATALLLLGLKGYAAWVTGSVAMLASLADTALDLVASAMTLFGVRFAALPPDHNHRFGHGKAEALVALFQVALIAASGLAIFARAIERLLGGAATEDTGFGIGASLAAIVITAGLLAYQRHVIARTGSVAIRADHAHYQADVVLNVAVIATLLIERLLGWAMVDPLAGMAIALWLLWGAWQGSATAIDQLMDKEWPEERRRDFVAVASRHPEVRGLHDLRTRTSGSHDFVQFHIWMDPALSVAAAHDVVEQIERDLAIAFPGTEVFIHIDPEGKIDHPGNDLVEADLVAQLKEP
ncbi:cation diffusion facilitator family transporter [Sphingomonas sp.]|uniref:cation diffusion facilitator family transporter n=1 Tax=Sphingomonas sp. TaxID=28214 RepID=UPI001E0F93B5|nr:cation diffusion facilitator family transporter [Sphingomonas sp.]MBX9797402.1 cation diffusion facilitator family transporter [Sphingomonas sp.]